MKLNRINTDGDGNIVINDIDGSTITVNVNTEEVVEFINSLKKQANRKNPDKIRILVLSTTSTRIGNFQKELEEPIPQFDGQYGEEPAFWKPFKHQEPIIDLLKEFQDRTEFKIDAFFVDSWSIDEEFKIDIEERFRKELIVVVDCNSLRCPINQKLISAFNHSSIGGGIIPICESFSEEEKKQFKNLCKINLSNWLRCKYDYLGRAYINIELEVPNKFMLFRRLTNIAVKNLDVLEIIDSGAWSNAFEKNGLKTQSSRI